MDFMMNYDIRLRYKAAYVRRHEIDVWGKIDYTRN